MADEDIISFTGTTRSGAEVSGSYTVGADGTVRDLLSAIEDAFSDEMSASIDTSGRLVVTNKMVGSSQLSLSIPIVEGLNFGSVDVTAGAGDGSQEGRYALSITATDDGSGHLVLKSDEYGSGSSFTVSQDTDSYQEVVYTNTSNTTIASSGTVYISGQAGGSSGTAWTDIYGASVSDLETIRISGKTHGGVDVGPTDYTINTATDTVDDLLNTIQTAFGGAGQVDVFIRDGKIMLEDKTSGASSMELTLTYLGTGSLSLGTFDQTTERDLDLGLINGTASGQDVAGTINGETATGSGQALRGDEGNATTEGLTVEYSGTSNNVNAGNVTITLGLAELFERTLFSISDPIDGYMTFKQNSLQENIERFDTRIEELEARLDRKMEMLVNRFVAMELALSKIQNMSSWLTGQINAAASAWG